MEDLTLSLGTRALLESALRGYQDALDDGPAVEYLSTRGITRQTAASLGLGYVSDPAPGHENYRGRIVIPYYGAQVRPGIPPALGTLRFKAIPDSHGGITGPKILGLPGHVGRLYNVRVLVEDLTEIAVAEGEPDVWTMEQIGAIRAVGCPGAKSWTKQMATLLKDYVRVYVLAQSDDSGESMDWARGVAKTVRNCEIVSAPEGHDWNSFFVAEGRDAVLERMGFNSGQ